MSKLSASFPCVLACASFLFAQAAPAAGPAKEGSFDTLRCVAGTVEFLTEAKGASAAFVDVIGTPMAKEGELFFGTSVRCLAYVSTIDKESKIYGSCLYTDRDGDHFLANYSGGTSDPAVTEGGPWKAVAGTGKFEGLEAGGTWTHVNVPAKQARANWYNGCDRDSGHWKLK